MITRCALLRFPLYARLSDAQRQIVRQQCIYPLLTCVPVSLAKYAISLTCIVVAAWLGAFSGLLQSLMTGFAAFFLMPALLDLWLVTRHRRDIEAYIRSRELDIRPAA